MDKKLYKITWVDIERGGAWTTINDFDKWQLPEVTSICYIYSEDDNVVKTFASYGYNDDGTIEYGDTNIFPKSVIIKRELIDDTIQTHNPMNTPVARFPSETGVQYISIDKGCKINPELKHGLNKLEVKGND